MQDFFEALTSECKNTALPEEFNYFEKLIGSWAIDYIESNNSLSIKGEWHFSWVLEGMAIQDVIILPDYEYGTSLRIYNPDTHAWDKTTPRLIQFHTLKNAVNPPFLGGFSIFNTVVA